jgi:hypothetical protein
VSEFDEFEVAPPEVEAVATADEASNTEGETLLATPFGYAFASSDNSLPLITHEGVTVSASEAEFILLESDEHDGKVYVVKNETEKED